MEGKARSIVDELPLPIDRPKIGGVPRVLERKTEIRRNLVSPCHAWDGNRSRVERSCALR